MAQITRVMVLTGARAGSTCLLHKWQFNSGRLTLRGDEKSVEGTQLYLGRVFAAYPEGSDELLAAQRRDHGNPALAPRQRQSADPVSGAVQSEQRGPAPVPADIGNGSVEGAAGQAGSVPPGDGHEDARAARIRAAVTQLDPAKDEHWTADGLPRVDAVAALSGEQSVNRRDVERYAPDVVRNR